MDKLHISKVWVDDKNVYATTAEGVTATYAFAQWPSLLKANDEQRRDFYLSYSGIHWPQIDEDLSFEGMFANANVCKRTELEDSVIFES